MNGSRTRGSQCAASSRRLSTSGSLPATSSVPAPQASGSGERPSQGGRGNVASTVILLPSTLAGR